MISTLLLCAGESRRMGTAKALLHYRGETLISRALRQLILTQSGEIICVTGAPEIEGEIQNFGPFAKIKIARNQNPSAGMLSSIQVGLQAMSAKSEAVVITLVDLPFLEAKDFDQLVAGRSDRLTRFRYQGQPGHPVLVPRRYFNEILEAPPQDKGCAFLFQKYADEIHWVEAESARGLLDIDTPEDYSAHLTS